MPEAGPEAGPRRARVLLVDDQPSMVWLIGKVLKDVGFEVATATTSREAIESYGECRCDAVLIDYRLPDGDGLRLLGSLRERDITCRAVLMTSYGSQELRQEALRAGFLGFLDKPFQNEALIELLKRVSKPGAFPGRESAPGNPVPDVPGGSRKP